MVEAVASSGRLDIFARISFCFSFSGDRYMLWDCADFKEIPPFSARHNWDTPRHGEPM